MTELTHLDSEGNARMVDTSRKAETMREATASGAVLMSRDTLEAVISGRTPKGDVLATARIAGISAAKRTFELIPLCHPLRLTSISVRLDPDPARGRIDISATVKAFDRTGVEMEALTAVSVAALTLYDMCKALERTMVLTEIRLEEKQGGRSGRFRREATSQEGDG